MIICFTCDLFLSIWFIYLYMIHLFSFDSLIYIWFIFIITAFVCVAAIQSSSLGNIRTLHKYCNIWLLLHIHTEHYSLIRPKLMIWRGTIKAATVLVSSLWILLMPHKNRCDFCFFFILAQCVTWCSSGLMIQWHVALLMIMIHLCIYLKMRRKKMFEESILVWN